MSFLFLDFKVWKKIRSGEEVEYGQKSHFKNISATRQSKWALKQYFYTKKKILIFGRVRKCIKKDIQLVLGQKKT